jgi:hypothetical protein
VVGHVHLHAALLVGQRHHRADESCGMYRCTVTMGSRISRMRPMVGHLARVLDLQHRAVVELDLVDHAGRGGHQVLVELALQPLLHDLHVQQAQEAAAESRSPAPG